MAEIEVAPATIFDVAEREEKGLFAQDPEPIVENVVENQGQIEIATRRDQNDPFMVKNTESVPEVPIEAASDTSPEEPKPEPIPEKLSARHFKAMKEKSERERLDLLRQLEQERARNAQPVPTPQRPNALEPDAFVEGKDLAFHAAEIEQLKLELAQYKQNMAIEVTKARLASEYPDFNKILTDENFAVLQAEDPETAASLANSHADAYTVGKATYKAIKRLNLVEDVYVQDKAQVRKNLSKPRPLASIVAQPGTTPIQKANAFGYDLTPELEKALWQEVQDNTR